MKGSLFEFVKYFWEVINTNELILNWHIEYLCDEVQLILDKYVLDKTPHISNDKWYHGIVDSTSLNTVINIAPGTSKSTIISRMALGWLWANDTTKTAITETIDANNASEFSTTTRDLILSDEYQELFPHVKIRKDVSAKTFYQNVDGGRRYSVTTKGKSKTGKHADLLIDDDPMDYMTAQSETEAQSCIEGFKALQTRKKDKSKVPYILVMQRLSHFDTTTHALKSLNNVKHICLPAENKHNNVVPKELNQFYIDGLLDSVRLTPQILADSKKGLNDDNSPMSDSAYEIQFNQLEINPEGLLYKINFYKGSELKDENSISLSSIDPSNGVDYFANPYAKLINNKIYIHDVIYNHYESKSNIDIILQKTEIHNPLYTLIEVNGIGSVFYSLLNVAGKTAVNHSTNKITRLQAFAWIISEYFYFDEENTNPEYVAMITHLKKFPKNCNATNDDIEDALTTLAELVFKQFRIIFNK